jgi:SulP family sulfate permease
MDMTGLQTFSELIEQFHQRGVRVLLCEANTRVKQKIQEMGILRWVQDGRIDATLSAAIHHIPVDTTLLTELTPYPAKW